MPIAWLKVFAPVLVTLLMNIADMSSTLLVFHAVMFGLHEIYFHNRPLMSVTSDTFQTSIEP